MLRLLCGDALLENQLTKFLFSPKIRAGLFTIQPCGWGFIKTTVSKIFPSIAFFMSLVKVYDSWKL